MSEKNPLFWRIVGFVIMAILVVGFVLALSLPVLQKQFGFQLPPALQSFVKWLPFN